MAILWDLDAEKDAVVVLTVGRERRAYTPPQLREALESSVSQASAIPQPPAAALENDESAAALNAAQLGRSLAWVLHDIEEGKTGIAIVNIRIEKLLQSFDGKMPQRPSKIGGLLVRIMAEVGETETIMVFIHRFDFLENPHSDDRKIVNDFIKKQRDIEAAENA